MYGSFPPQNGMLSSLGIFDWVVEFVQNYLHTLSSVGRDTQTYLRKVVPGKDP